MQNQTFDTAKSVTTKKKTWIARLIDGLLTPSTQHSYSSLASMPDHALRDIGVSRHELRALAHRPTPFDAFKLLGKLRIPDARYETRTYK